MAIVAECFLPEINGVTNSVLRVIEQLERRGHEVAVIAPGIGPSSYRSAPVERVPAISLPLYRSLPIGIPSGQVRRALERFHPDVVHLAAPAVLGAAGALVARRMGIPVVAVYQTDLAGFARRYRLGVASGLLWTWLRRIHTNVDLTLAPSSLTTWELEQHGIGPVAVWGRGVDRRRFNPGHRSDRLRARLAPRGEVLVGYVGRLAREKQVDLLGHTLGVPGTRVIVVGDGPERVQLEKRLPGATFMGFLDGDRLSQAVASLDVFVHTGAHETFCQSVQEALASGVPVVAPASGGPMDLVLHGQNGFLYPAANPMLIRGAVGSLAGSAELRRAMSIRAVESVEGRTWESLGSQLVEHYDRVLGGAGVGGGRRHSRIAA